MAVSHSESPLHFADCRDESVIVGYYTYAEVVDSLGIGLRQRVEILKGLSCDSELLIMDEPTASLSGKEAALLFSIMNKLRDQGVSIIYISHRLEEVYMLSDRLTILQDGRNAAILEKEEIIPKDVIQTMIGKVVDESAGSSKVLKRNTNDVVLKVEGLPRKGFFVIFSKFGRIGPKGSLFLPPLRC